MDMLRNVPEQLAKIWDTLGYLAIFGLAYYCARGRRRLPVPRFYLGLVLAAYAVYVLLYAMTGRATERYYRPLLARGRLELFAREPAPDRLQGRDDPAEME